jgi:hypothetical protein
MRPYPARIALFALSALWLSPAWPGPPEFSIEIRSNLFWPAEIVIPADTKVRLVIHNSDSTPEEFESYELNREKVIMGGRKAIVFIGPLSPGIYPFFGEFHPDTALGRIIVE